MVVASDGLIWGTRVGGTVFRARYYTESIGSVWDDERTLTGSGTDLYFSGVFFSLNTSKGSNDAVLMEEGRIKFGDSKMFINGSIQTTSGARVFTLSLSGVDTVFREIIPGAHVSNYFGTDVMKTIYLRQLPTGSLF